MSEVADYCSYLLRMWQVPTDGESAWRIQLENIQSGKKCGFTSLEELLTYLSQVTSKSHTMSEGNQSEVQG